MNLNTNVWHVIPVNDKKAHAGTGIKCPCNPTIEIQANKEFKGLIVKHNSWDGSLGKKSKVNI